MTARASRDLGLFWVLAIVLSSPVLAQSWFSSAWPDTDLETRNVELSEIMSGGVPKDGIPSIDSPSFDDVATAAEWLDPDEPVILLRHAGVARAYPLQILTYHEIVNDVIADLPVSVTYCPLCNAAIVFDRRVGDQVLDFGTTGMLRKSDLVMYDRQTESWWQQFSGTGIVGDYTGTRLETLPADVVSFGQFAGRFADGQVLSRRTGKPRPYGRNPYTGYDRIGNRPFLFNEPVDKRLPAMERILNVSIGGTHKIYPYSRLENRSTVNDVVSDTPVLVLSTAKVRSALDGNSIADSRFIPVAIAYDRRIDGQVLSFSRKGVAIVDAETGSEWNLFGEAVKGPLEGARLKNLGGGSHFAFAWLAFHPDSSIFEAE